MIMLSTPTPALPITFKEPLAPVSMTSRVTWVALLTTNASKSPISLILEPLNLNINL